MKKIMFVSSSGGHLVQLESIAAYVGKDLCRVTVTCDQVSIDNIDRSYVISDCYFSAFQKVLKSSLQIFKIIRKERPDIILTTGAAVGGIAIFIGWFFRVKSIWVDSVANAKQASLCGRLVKFFANKWVSQWQEVARNNKGLYFGKVFNVFERGDTATF